MVSVLVPHEWAEPLNTLVKCYDPAKEQPGRFAHGIFRYDIVNGTRFVEVVTGEKDKVPERKRA